MIARLILRIGRVTLQVTKDQYPVCFSNNRRLPSSASSSDSAIAERWPVASAFLNLGGIAGEFSRRGLLKRGAGSQVARVGQADDGNRCPTPSHRCSSPHHHSTSLAEQGGTGIAIDDPWGVRTTGHEWDAVRPRRRARRSACLLDCQLAGVDCRNFPSFEAEIAGEFECASKIGEMLGVF
jgi:hypothetical protein